MSLTEITVPENVTELGSLVFSGCTGLKEIYLNCTITELPITPFQNCSNIEILTLPDTLTAIGDNAFNGMRKLREVELPEALVSIGSGAFQNCSALTVPNPYENVAENLFPVTLIVKDRRDHIADQRSVVELQMIQRTVSPIEKIVYELRCIHVPSPPFTYLYAG